MNKPKISPQGEYDGACFLYSVVNAYKALTGKNPTLKMWDKSVENIPFRNDFLINVGTYWYDDNMELYELAIQRMFEKFTKNKIAFEIKSFHEISSRKALEKLIGKNSVVILNIGSEHWVCGVDYNKENIFLADSYQLFSEVQKYSEMKSDKFERYYNSNKTLSDISWLYNPSVLQIIIKNA